MCFVVFFLVFLGFIVLFVNWVVGSYVSNIFEDWYDLLFFVNCKLIRYIFRIIDDSFCGCINGELI